MRKTRQFIHAIAATLVAFSLVGGMQARAADADPALVAAAKKEGEVLWYTALISNLIVQPLIEAFNKKYPDIAIKHQRMDTGEVVLKVQSEARANQRMADIIDGGGQMIPPLAQAGLLEKFTPKNAADLPARLKDKDGLWTATSVLYLTAAYNTDLVKDADAPKTYDDLLDPKWKGKIAWTANPFLSGPPAFIGNILMLKGKDAGMAYLKKLAENKIINVAANQRGVLDTVTSGQYPMALLVFNHHVVLDQAKGAPEKWIKMEPLIEVHNLISLVKNAPHPNAAKLFLEFLTSEDGQKVFAAKGYLPASPKVDASTPGLKPESGNFKVTAITPDMTAELPGWIKIYDELFK